MIEACEEHIEKYRPESDLRPVFFGLSSRSG